MQGDPSIKHEPLQFAQLRGRQSWSGTSSTNDRTRVHRRGHVNVRAFDYVLYKYIVNRNNRHISAATWATGEATGLLVRCVRLKQLSVVALCVLDRSHQACPLDGCIVLHRLVIDISHVVLSAGSFGEIEELQINHGAVLLCVRRRDEKQLRNVAR